MDGRFIHRWDITLIGHPTRLMNSICPKGGPEKVPYIPIIGGFSRQGTLQVPPEVPQNSKYIIPVYTKLGKAQRESRLKYPKGPRPNPELRALQPTSRPLWAFTDSFLFRKLYFHRPTQAGTHRRSLYMGHSLKLDSACTGYKKAGDACTPLFPTSTPPSLKVYPGPTLTLTMPPAVLWRVLAGQAPNESLREYVCTSRK